MHNVLDDCLVGIALLASAAYAIFSLGPRSLRRRSLSALAAGAARMPAVFGLRRFAGRLERAAAAKSAGSCGGCDSCESAGAKTETGEVSVPAAQIKRR
jgi:hypothetical protein